MLSYLSIRSAFRSRRPSDSRALKRQLANRIGPVVRLDVMAEIQFRKWAGTDHLRHTKFVVLRGDKDPAKVVRELNVSMQP
jgi:ATP-dependent DNA ligase